MHSRAVAIAAFLVLSGACAGHAASMDQVLRQLELPEGFRIEIWAELPNAREMALAPDLRTVFVTDENETVWALKAAGPGTKPTPEAAIQGLQEPSGIGYRDGWLYVAERTRLLRYKASDLGAGHPKREIIATGFPDETHHGTRALSIDAQGRIYVAMGVPCNLCEPSGIEDAIIRFDANGGWREVFATGIRNSVGMDFDPSTGVCYFTDNGVDHMGDDSPPDELNRAPEPGLFFGYPYFGGGRDRTAKFADKQPPKTVTFPALDFHAHVAALGVAFYRGGMFPPDYDGDLFVAQHGSWNRTVPIGYRVVRVRFVEGKPTKAEPFASGWLTEDEEVLGRPADVLQAEDGALLVSDDYNGAIYRISYER